MQEELKQLKEILDRHNKKIFEMISDKRERKITSDEFMKLLSIEDNKTTDELKTFIDSQPDRNKLDIVLIVMSIDFNSTIKSLINIEDYKKLITINTL